MVELPLGSVLRGAKVPRLTELRIGPAGLGGEFVGLG